MRWLACRVCFGVRSGFNRLLFQRIYFLGVGLRSVEIDIAACLQRQLPVVVYAQTALLYLGRDEDVVLLS
jgi:hypothetical protein